MEIKCSSYLDNMLLDIENLIHLLKEYFDDVNILASDVQGKKITLSRFNTSIEDYMLAERGFVVRVNKDGRLMEYSFNTWEDLQILNDKIVETYERQIANQEEMEITSFDSLTLDQSMVFETRESEVEIGIDDISLSEIVDKLNHLQKVAFDYCPELIDFKSQLAYLVTSKLFVSDTKTLKQAYMTTSMLGMAIIKDDNGKVYMDYDGHNGLYGFEAMNSFEKMIPSIIDKTIELTKTEKVIPGEYEVICTPEVAGLIAHEAFGHGVEMDMFVKNRALARDYIDYKVASDIVTMKDGVRCYKQVASYLFDDEGTLGTNTTIIENGVLKSGISDYASSQRLKTKPTGNGRRESFERKAYTRMTNTYFEKGEHTLDEMMASIDYGYLLDGVISGMEDPKHWGIQCMITRGKEIKNGRLTGKIISPVILTGYVPDLLSNISMVGDEVFLSGNGLCGKGYKEYVRVSDGGPYLKTKARLG